MDQSRNQTEKLKQVITDLNNDRAWLLQQIDKGRWSKLRIELAALERELGHLLTKASEKIE